MAVDRQHLQATTTRSLSRQAARVRQQNRMVCAPPPALPIPLPVAPSRRSAADWWRSERESDHFLSWPSAAASWFFTFPLPLSGLLGLPRAVGQSGLRQAFDDLDELVAAVACWQASRTGSRAWQPG
jgi:hypothetical protein